MARTRLWILGAADPEMALIERLLIEAGECVAYALDATGERVHPGSAYRGVSHRYVTDCGPADEPETWYLVECDVPIPPAAEVVRIDHHREGDPGYGRPPAEFADAASVGQVWAVLHPATTPPLEILLAAAADHCLGAAYRGECPGIDPDALMRWRAETRAAYQGRSVEELLADINEAYEEVMAAPVGYLLYTEEVCTDRDCGCGGATHPRPVLETMFVDFRSRQLRELPEAALRAGVAYIATVEDRDGRQKVVLGGATPLTVRAFLGMFTTDERYVDEHCAPVRGFVQAHGLVDSYGDPARGFAGAYFDPARETLTPLGLAEPGRTW